MTSGLRSATLSFALVVMTFSARAADHLQVRPGMSFSEIERTLKPKCKEFLVNGNPGNDKYVTCIMGEGHYPSVVTATVTKRDRVSYIQWREVVGPILPDNHAEAAAVALGFSAPKAECTLFAKTTACWPGAGGTTLYDGGYEAVSGIYTLYLVNDGIEKADAKEIKQR